MATKLIDDTYLTDIANAIRTKKGTSNTITPPEMASEILSIPTSSSPGTINIVNGFRRDAIALSGYVRANHFISLESIVEKEIMAQYQWGANGQNAGAVFWNWAPVSDDTIIWFWYYSLYSAALGSTVYDFYYSLGKVGVDGSFSVVDTGILPFGNYDDPNWDRDVAELWNIGQQGVASNFPSRIYRAKNGTMMFHQWNLYQPFIVQNDAVVWGTCDKKTNQPMKKLMSNTEQYYQCKSSYGTIGDDYIIYTYIGPDSGSGGGLTKHEMRIAIMELKNNKIGSVLSNNLTGTTPKAVWPGNVIKFSENQFAATWGETVNGTYVQVAASFSTVWNSSLGSTGFWDFDSITDKAYWAGDTSTKYEPIGDTGSYIAWDSTNGKYVVLNIYNAGAMAASYAQLTAASPQNSKINQILGNSLPSGGTICDIESMGNDFFGVPVFTFKQMLNNVRYYTGEIRVYKIKNNTLYYMGNIMINNGNTTNTNLASSAELMKIGGRFLLWNQTDNLNTFKTIWVNTARSIVSTRTGTKPAAGVSITDCTRGPNPSAGQIRAGGEAWFVIDITDPTASDL